ncbi:MAG: hypothetical protein OXI96_05155 [Acidimicrobiaceae bacterium]|nr:hypothetical protein [Acidimicrobiaceae bacterium]
MNIVILISLLIPSAAVVLYVISRSSLLKLADKSSDTQGMILQAVIVIIVTLVIIGITFIALLSRYHQEETPDEETSSASISTLQLF